MSIDNNANKQKPSLLWLWLAAATVAVVVVLVSGIFFLIPLIYPSQPPQDKMAAILTEPPPPPPPPPQASSSPQGSANIIMGLSNSPSSTHPKRIFLSVGVAQSLLIQKSVPMYPPIARAARISGTVVLHVVISTTGLVKDIHVVSGPAMLQQSALDAVKNWRYRPYLLNNQPVEVETTVNVVYTLSD